MLCNYFFANMLHVVYATFVVIVAVNVHVATASDLDTDPILPTIVGCACVAEVCRRGGRFAFEFAIDWLRELLKS